MLERRGQDNIIINIEGYDGVGFSWNSFHKAMCLQKKKCLDVIKEMNMDRQENVTDAALFGDHTTVEILKIQVQIILFK